VANQYYVEVTVTHSKIPAGFYSIHAENEYTIYYTPNALETFELANRVWKENEYGVFFVKHRTKIPTKLSSEELKEFMWVKLKAQDLT